MVLSQIDQNLVGATKVTFRIKHWKKIGHTWCHWRIEVIKYSRILNTFLPEDELIADFFRFRKFDYYRQKASVVFERFIPVS